MNESSTAAQDVPIVGVFRLQTQAEEAISALKDANFAEEHIFTTQYQGARADDTRVIVHVTTTGRDQEAVGLLVHYGANNADLPLGTEMVRGNLIPQTQDAMSPLSQRPTIVEPEALPPDPDLTEYRGE